jgi:hypothetical protein
MTTGSVSILWDLEDDPDGNYRHILEGHDLTPEEVEEVLLNPGNGTARSRTSGNLATFGWTSGGRYIVVIWECVFEDPLMIYPSTAYPVPPPRDEKP